MSITGRTIAYFAFAGFCLLSSSRDVLSEFLFKDQAYHTDPVFLLFIYSAVTQIIAGILILFGAPGKTATEIFLPGVWKNALLLNIFTLAAFLLYFVAIDSPAGAAVNSFIDYGSGPVFTALVGAALMKEALDRVFIWSAAAAIVGIAVLAAPRVGSGISTWWLMGAIVALLGSLAGAFYRVYFKILLNAGMSKSTIVFLRLMGITLVLGGILLVHPGLFRLDILVQTALIGVFGFAIPLFLVLGAIQRLEVRSYAMLLFFLPATTYLLSAALGYGHLYISDLAAGGLMLFGVALHEAHARRSSKAS
jgi:drug/metabolite transporter (DMT)-like permease